MGKVFVTESYLDDIADAIRGKNGTENTYKPSQMAAAITALPDPAVLDDKTITANGTYDPSDDDLDGYSEVTVNVPNSYAAGDEGKVVSNGALVAQTSRSSDITVNGTYDTTLNDEVTVNVSGGGGGVELLTRSEWNALSTAQKQAKGKIAIEDYTSGFHRGLLVNGADYDGHDQIVDRGFDLYYADYHGNSRTDKGIQNNSYFVYFCHDNMPDTYTLNGNTYTYAINIPGYFSSTTRVMADTRYVNDNTVSYVNGLKISGSQITDSHYDSGSYIAIAGGWYGYPAGTVYQNASSTSSNSITLSEAHKTLLIFIAGSIPNMENNSSISINGTTYQATVVPPKYDSVSSIYLALQIDNNVDTQITATFGIACFNYMSIIGID